MKTASKARLQTWSTAFEIALGTSLGPGGGMRPTEGNDT
jgi:hypothetical protein